MNNCYGCGKLIEKNGYCKSCSKKTLKELGFKSQSRTKNAYQERKKIEQEIWERYAQGFERSQGTRPYKTFQKKKLIQIAVEVMQKKEK